MVHGSSPVRTRFMLGAYCARHASANAPPSMVLPFCRARSWTCVATEARQSTTVPNTSKTSALTGGAA